jgi:hypothetical protein
MYVLLMVVLFGAGAALAASGLAGGKKWKIAAGALVVLATVGFFALMSVWGEALWFASLGYSGRFWTALLAVGVGGLVGAAAGALGVYLCTWPIPRDPPVARVWPEVAGALVGLAWGVGNWDVLLKYWYRVATEVHEPILGLDAGFYMFTLPLYDAVFWLLIGAAMISLVAAVASLVAPRGEMDFRVNWPQLLSRREYADYRPMYVALAVVGLVLAWGLFLSIYHLMYSPFGAVAGPGWTDVKIRLPAYGIVALVIAAASLALMISPIARRLHGWAGRERPQFGAAGAVGVPLAIVAVVWLLGLGAAPALVQWLIVEPNEITMEKPYIEHNIRFTRQGFQLDKVEQREFAVSDEFTKQTASENQHVLSQVRLWDPRALVDVYKQFQEIRLYYEFPDVDIDRYTIDGGYEQVMVSPREMRIANLPPNSQTFVNRHFKYTHGYGLTMAPVSEFTPDGLPDLLVKDLPPKSEHDDLRVEQPQIYYGELTDEYAVVNTQEKEFDYPRGEANVYVRYDGSGGVQLSNLWRKFLYGWKLGGTRFLFSGYPTRESRVMFHRQIRNRAATLAPFLHFDRDPYVVLSAGRLYWIVDGYTTSAYYPYSEPFAGERRALRRRAPYGRLAGEQAEYLRGKNYVRNSVKAVVDAFEGSIDFYVFEPDDPMIRVWQRAFPKLFKPKEEMPDALLDHVRYPEGFLLTQGLVYAKYHMTDPTVFYNQEDLWVRATEKYYAQVQPVEPYYVMWKPPESEAIEFVQILPFTPKNRQVLIGWIAGMCDPGNYGRLLAYRFPKEKRVLGTQQVETKIDQDSHLSGQLTLWDQRGSNVIRGNVLAIPIDDTLLYV